MQIHLKLLRKVVNRQTNRQRRLHMLLGGGNKKSYVAYLRALLTNDPNDVQSHLSYLKPYKVTNLRQYSMHGLVYV